MAHLKLREENNCLNCGAEVHERFCTVCGQENRDHRISAFGLIAHFIGDLLHFDGKFFTTLRRLFFKPGFLPKEYIEGKRKKNVDPIKMYIFTSAIFFTLFFLFLDTSKDLTFNVTGKLDKNQRDSVIHKIKEELKNDTASAALLKKRALFSDSTKEVSFENLAEINKELSIINLTSKNYNTKEEYDAMQHTLAVEERDGWVKRIWMYKEMEVNEKFRQDGKLVIKSLIEVFLHKLPILLFISLPLFAFALKILYIRRKKFFYVDHGIFSLYQYVFSLSIFFLILALSKLNKVLQSGIIKFMLFSLVLYWIYYLYKALRIFYEQGKGKTILKMMLLFFFGLMINIFLFAIFFFFSIFQI